jgi:hypothetical protein
MRALDWNDAKVGSGGIEKMKYTQSKQNRTKTRNPNPHHNPKYSQTANNKVSRIYYSLFTVNIVGEWQLLN